MGHKRQWGCRQQQFSAFSLAISLETLETRPALLYSNTQCHQLFSDPKMHDLEWLFHIKFCFCAGLSGVRPCDFLK